MSKLAVLRQYRYSPAAGGIFGTIGKILGGAVNLVTGTKIFGSKTAAVQQAMPQVKLPFGVGAGPSFGVNPLLKGSSGGGTRKGRGITARELRGYRKVSNLLHKEGMVSKRARGRKS